MNRVCNVGLDGNANPTKMGLYAGVTRLVHQHSLCSIPFVCKLITGYNGIDKEDLKFMDNAWKLRVRAYDDMSPDDVRAKARAVRRADLNHDGAEDICRAFALVSREGSALRADLEASLLSTCEKTRKRRAQVLDDMCALSSRFPFEISQGRRAPSRGFQFVLIQVFGGLFLLARRLGVSVYSPSFTLL